jgi:hypothetical protein
MARLSYAGIELGILHTLECNRRAIRTPDDADYLWTEWTIDVVGVLNTSTLPATALGIGGAAGAAAIDRAIRHIIMQNRQRLFYRTEDGSVILNVGFPNKTQSGVAFGPQIALDANGGPKPRKFDIIEVQGMQTLIVRFVVQAYVNECVGVNLNNDSFAGVLGGSSPILANRFRRYEDTDATGGCLTTLVTEGTVTFRTDVIQARDILPDEYRGLFGFDVPPFFQRKRIFVQPMSDGVSVQYRVEDVERPIGLATVSQNHNVTKIEAHQTMTFTVTSSASMAAAAIAVASQTAGALAAAIAFLAPGVDEKRAEAFGNDIAEGVALAGTSLGVLAIGAPKAAVTIRARVTGNKNARRQDLMLIAAGIVIGRSFRAGAFPASQMTSTEDLMGKWVEVTGTFWQTNQVLAATGMLCMFQSVNNGGLLQSSEAVSFDVNNVNFVIGPLKIPINVPAALALAWRNMNQGNPNAPLIFASDVDFTNTLPPNAGGNMGTYPAVLAAAMLLPACTEPPMKGDFRMTDFQYRGTPSGHPQQGQLVP